MVLLPACAAVLVLWPSAADAQEAAAPILLHAQRLLDVRSGTYRPDQGLLITGGLITAVGPYAEIRRKAPQTARLVDLGTTTVMPGLIDAHAHVLDAMEGSWSAGDAIAITVLRGPSSRASNARQLRDIYLRNYRGTPEEGEANAAVRDYLEKSRASLKRALKSGVRIVAGCDMWMKYPVKTRGEATLTMLESLASEGMPLPEVLRSATITTADLLGPSLNIGTLEAGKVADIIAVDGDGDPLADLQALHHVKFVMKAGRVVTARAQ